MCYNNFTYGVDLGWLSQLEACGITWLDTDGNKKDVLDIMKDMGVDAVRLRVFVDPPSSFEWTKRDGTICMLGYADMNGMLEMARRVNDHGMKLMIDFHYSDHFADPEYQDIPKNWETHVFYQILVDVYAHTYYVMNRLKQEGIYPEWVQIGNEINNGMLLPYGDSKIHPGQLAQLLNSGYDAVKAVNSSTKVITHLAEGQDSSAFQQFFDQFLFKYNGKSDIIGLSYYPYWLGSDYTENIDALTKNINNLASRYKKEIMVCEVGGDESTPENSYDYLLAVIKALKSAPSQKGIGIFYWEPEGCSKVLPDGYPLGSAIQVSEKTLMITSAMKAYQASKQ